VDSKSIAFLQVMIALGVIGVLAFLIFLISRIALHNRGKSVTGQTVGYTPQWYEFLLAAVVVVATTIVFLWQFPPGGQVEWGNDARSMTFFVIMMIIGGAAIVVFLLVIFWRISQQPKTAPEDSSSSPPPSEMAAATAEPEPALARHEAPSAVRLLGLLGFVVAFLILNWVYVQPADQHFLMSTLIYPAGLVVALVMLFDKANRTWNVKLPGETVREWFFCNAVLFLYILGFLNLRQSSGDETYPGFFWDVLHVVGFLFIFWIIDRATTRLRFLVVHLYFVALPILLLIWRAVQNVEIVADISWWSTIWPFFGLAIIFLVLEIIILIINRESENQAIGMAKDVVFLILYVILLLAARPDVPVT